MAPFRSPRSRPASVRPRLRRGALLALALLLLGGATGCGSDEGERGLQPEREVASPESNKADAETEKERDRKEARQIQQAEREAFDHAETEEQTRD